ncbi:MAG: hypothetical protein ACRD01_14530 [Terriglobales bacterium]
MAPVFIRQIEFDAAMTPYRVAARLLDLGIGQHEVLQLAPMAGM